MGQKDAHTGQNNHKQSVKMHPETGCSHQEKGNGYILQSSAATALQESVKLFAKEL